MKYDYDLICIGLGPAGMAVSVMAVEMGLKVCAIEKEKIGGECMNVGCIPSKSILQISKLKHAADELKKMKMLTGKLPDVKSPFNKIAGFLKYINDKKTMKMFKNVKLYLKKGSASFVDSHTVKVGKKKVTAQKIFIATGTEPMIPPIEGIDGVDVLTNLNIFNLKKIPKSMTIVGGGAIGCEMAQAFSRLGTKCNIVQMDSYLIPLGDPEAGAILADAFESEGIGVYNSKRIVSIKKVGTQVVLKTEDGLTIKSEKLLMAAGRKIVLDELKLENAGIKYGKRGIKVDSKYRTNIKHIYGVGDCNGGVMLSHAAMHQGMIAIMNAVSPLAMFKYKKYVIPWTVFTEPQVSAVGMTEAQLNKKKIKFKVYIKKYEDYGAAIAENLGVGFVKVFANSRGKVFGASIVGDGSGEMINEWALIIQKKIKLMSILFLAHSFPTMGFMSKGIAEDWMMKKMKSKFLQKIIKLFYHKF